MKKISLAIVACIALLGVDRLANSTTVNPTSNVLGDSANTASTLVYRDSSGDFAAHVGSFTAIAAGVVDTLAIATNALDTRTLAWVNTSNVSSGKIVCVMGGNSRQFGVCSGGITAAACTCQ